MLKAMFRVDLNEQFVKYYMCANWVLLVLMVIVATVVSSLTMATGILVGGFVANFNCMGLNRDCRRMVRWRTILGYLGGFAVRLGLITLAVTVAFLVFPNFLSPVGFIIGLSVVVINFYILVLTMVINRFRFKEAV